MKGLLLAVIMSEWMVDRMEGYIKDTLRQDLGQIISLALLNGEGKSVEGNGSTRGGAGTFENKSQPRSRWVARCQDLSTQLLWSQALITKSFKLPDKNNVFTSETSEVLKAKAKAQAKYFPFQDGWSDEECQCVSISMHLTPKGKQRLVEIEKVRINGEMNGLNIKALPKEALGKHVAGSANERTTK